MSTTATVTTIAVSWLGSIGAAVTGFVKQVKRVETQVSATIVEVEKQLDAALAEVATLTAKVEALTPPPAPKAAAKKPTPKA